jgi:hypothetical protein
MAVSGSAMSATARIFESLVMVKTPGRNIGSCTVEAGFWPEVAPAVKVFSCRIGALDSNFSFLVGAIAFERTSGWCCSCVEFLVPTN